MSLADDRYSRPTADEAPHRATSTAAISVAETLGQWRVRVGDAQTFARLSQALLEGGGEIAAMRRQHVRRLAATELRGLSLLPAPDLALLRSPSGSRASGIELRGPDTAAVEDYVLSLRDEALTELRFLEGDEIVGRAELLVHLRNGRRLLSELVGAVELLETVLYPRTCNPNITVSAALAHAAIGARREISIDGDGDTEVPNVRGLLRLFAEVLSTVGDRPYVYVTKPEPWVELSVSPESCSVGEFPLSKGRAELLRLAAYLIRTQAEFQHGSWRLAMFASG